VPELPEVETIRRELEPLVAGRTIEQVVITDTRLVQPASPSDFEAALAGERIGALERHGKYLLLRFESGRTLATHLRMTGSFRYLEGGSPVDPYRRARLELDDGSRLDYRDVRRFGTWRLLEAGELESFLAARVGPEPLEPEFTTELLRERLDGRRAPLKAAVLDQKTVAGLGNIYADEALWRARLHPATPAGSLSRRAIVRLHQAVRETLALGIARQGATLRDYTLPDGERGTMQDEFVVYGRDGEPCARCGARIAKIRVGGRGTWFCPRCQRRR